MRLREVVSLADLTTLGSANPVHHGLINYGIQTQSNMLSPKKIDLYRSFVEGVYQSLCARAFLYAPYSFLLISNKFWMGRRVGG